MDTFMATIPKSIYTKEREYIVVQRSIKNSLEHINAELST